MARLFGYDPDEDYSGFDAIPDGEYNAAIVESKEKQNQKRTGHFLELIFEILDGRYKGRRLWERLNLDNPSELCVRIAKAKLKTICQALGGIRPTDSVDLHNIPLLLQVGTEERTDTGEKVNVIRKFLARQIAVPDIGNSTSKPPWKKE